MSTLHIAQPCAESWATMTPSGPNRHCAACAKTVVDFTQKTDAEILAYLTLAASGPACGRFRAGQLARPLLPAEPTNRWRTWLAALLTLGGVLGSERAGAQGGSYPATHRLPATIHPSESQLATSASPVSLMPTAPGGPLLVHGVVTDASTGEPLLGVTVVVKGTTRGVSTDANGEFTLPLENSKPELALVVSFINYETQEITVAGVAPVAISLKASQQWMGEVVVTHPLPAPWHPRRLYHWSKYWLTWPFHR